jgi:hypothetical protein
MTTERRDTDQNADPAAADQADGAEARAGTATADPPHDDPAGPSTADLANAGHGREAAIEDDEDDGPTPLFAEGDASGYRDRWVDVQTQFVDDPRQAVQHADQLVAELMQKLAETFAGERSELEQQWDRDGKVSTEDLRISMQRYRSFFDRLLSL